MKKLRIVLIIILVLAMSGCSPTVDTADTDALQSKIEILESDNISLKEENDLLKNENLGLEFRNENLKEENLQLKNNQVTSGNKEINLVRLIGNRLYYTFEEQTEYAQVLSIVGENINDIVEEFEDVYLNGSSGPFKVKVTGTIYDFKLVSVVWNEQTNDFEEGNMLAILPEVTNQNIIIDTILPEGMPAEEIQWKDSSGNQYSYTISYDGYGFGGIILWNN